MTKVNKSNVPNRGDGQIFENGKLEDAWGNAASFKESNKLIQEFIAGGPLKLPEEEKAFFTILPDNRPGIMRYRFSGKEGGMIKDFQLVSFSPQDLPEAFWKGIKNLLDNPQANVGAQGTFQEWESLRLPRPE